MAVVPSEILKLGDLEPHLDPKRRVEVRQWLVEQEGLRFPDDGTADGDALALAARELPRPPVEILGEVEDARGRFDLAVDLGLGLTRHAQSESDVLAHAHVRIERVGLEHHRQAALGRRRVDDIGPVDQDLAAGGVLQPGDETQQRRLSTAGRSDEHDERAVGDGEVDVLDDVDLAEAFLDALELDLSHNRRSLFHGAEGETADQLPLAEPAEHQDGRDSEGRGG